MCIKSFIKGIKSGWNTQKKGGILDVMWCSRCRTKQPIYMDGHFIKCVGCQNIIVAGDDKVIDIE